MSTLPETNASAPVETFLMIWYSIPSRWLALFPVIEVSCDLDRLVWLEFHEFERTGADRMRAHVARGHVARIDRGKAGGEQGDKGRLRPLQAERGLKIAVGGDLFEVPVPGLAGIDAQFFARLPGEEIPGAQHVLRGKGFAVVPFDPFAQSEGQVGLVLVPGPLAGEVRHDRL